MGYKLTGAYIYAPKLPSEYQEVEYIESSWTQYINTGYAPSNNTKVIFGMWWWTSSPGRWGTAFWAREWRTPDNWNNSKWFTIAYDKNTWYVVMFGRGYNNNISTVPDFWIIDWSNHIVQEWWDGIYIDWTLKMSLTAYTFTSPVPMSIFCDNINWDNLNFSSYKLYYFKYYDSWTLVRDFVPCYRKADWEIWLYDLVNDVFYTNQGTGTFTKWNDVWLQEYQLRPSMSIRNWLIGYRPLETDNKDISGNGNDVTITGCSFGTVGNKAWIQLSTSFTNSPTNYITTPDLWTSTTFSFAGWLYKTTTDTSGNNDWTSFFENATADTANALRLRGKYNILRAAAYWNGQSDADGNTITPNTWTHYCITSDGVTAKVYIDGQYYNSFTAWTTTTDATWIFYIGYGCAYYSNQRRCWPWWVRQFMFYDKVLTAEEVLRIYTNTQ